MTLLAQATFRLVSQSLGSSGTEPLRVPRWRDQIPAWLLSLYFSLQPTGHSPHLVIGLLCAHIKRFSSSSYSFICRNMMLESRQIHRHSNLSESQCYSLSRGYMINFCPYICFGGCSQKQKILSHGDYLILGRIALKLLCLCFILLSHFSYQVLFLLCYEKKKKRKKILKHIHFWS